MLLLFLIPTLTFLAFGTLLVQYYTMKNQKEELENQLATIKNNVHSLDVIQALNGIFEIHVTIDPENNYFKLVNFIKRFEKEKGFKIVFAISSVANNQYMLSHFTRKTDEQEAINSANQIAADLTEEGIKVLRVKVEGHNAKGTPQTNKDYIEVEKYLTQKYNNKCGKPYFEFHVKVADHKNRTDYFKNLEEAVRQYNGVAISYNLCSSNRKPLLTIRVYNSGFITAQQYKDKVMNELKDIGYIFEDNLQQEFSLYDTNSELDKNWLLYL
jgi:hypothetical protein